MKHIYKYKIGDRVRLTRREYPPTVMTAFEKLQNREATIVSLEEARNYDESMNYFYKMKEIRYGWHESNIDCLVKAVRQPKPIINRFDILDIR